MTTKLPSRLLEAAATQQAPLLQSGFEMRRVTGRDDWQRVRTLRYEALRSRGEIEENPEHGHADSHDIALNTMTFLLTRNGRPVASTRSTVSSATRRWSLPAMEVFSREIEDVAGPDATLVEASLTVVDPASSADPKTALFHLFKAHMLHCAAENADWLVVGVRDSQIGFFRRMFNMEILSGAEKYPGLEVPRVLMGLDYRAQAPLIFKRIPVLAVNDGDEADFEASEAITFPEQRRLRQVAA